MKKEVDRQSKRALTSSTTSQIEGSGIQQCHVLALSTVRSLPQGMNYLASIAKITAFYCLP